MYEYKKFLMVGRAVCVSRVAAAKRKNGRGSGMFKPRTFTASGGFIVY